MVKTLSGIFLTICFAASIVSATHFKRMGVFEDKKNNPTDYLVIFKAQADVSGADRLSDKKEKGRFVFHALREQAQQTQGPVTEFLKSKNLRFQNFLVLNAIYIAGGPTALPGDFPPPVPVAVIEELKTFKEVDRIVVAPTISAELTPPEALMPKFGNQAVPVTAENLKSVGATEVWEKLKVRGHGIVVASQDTG